MPDGSYGHPEFYPRPDRTLYVCGTNMSDMTPLPEYASEVVPSDEGVERLKQLVNIVVRKEWIDVDALEPSDFVKQACYRPDSSKTNLPIIGKIGNGYARFFDSFSNWHRCSIRASSSFFRRLWVASGHQVWGILLGNVSFVLLFSLN